MSMGATVSVLGLYNYNPDLFENMVFPADFSDDDKQTTIENILLECAELELLFPGYESLHDAIGIWSKMHLKVWERIFNVSELEYNPIENYNRLEMETVGEDRSISHSGNDVNTSSGTDTETINSTAAAVHSGTDTQTNKITAYDSNGLLTHDTSDLQHGESVTDTNNGTAATAYGKTETMQHGLVIDNEGTITRENHTTGNIGVTTSQQMIEQELEITAKLNVIEMIVNSFKNRFCLLVY